MEYRRSTDRLSYQMTGGVFHTKVLGPFAGGQYCERVGCSLTISTSSWGRLGLGLSDSNAQTVENWQASRKLIRREERNAVGPSSWGNSHVRMRVFSGFQYQLDLPIWIWVDHGPVFVVARFEGETSLQLDWLVWAVFAQPVGERVVRPDVPFTERDGGGGIETAGTGGIS